MTEEVQISESAADPAPGGSSAPSTQDESSRGMPPTGEQRRSMREIMESEAVKAEETAKSSDKDSDTSKPKRAEKAEKKTPAPKAEEDGENDKADKAGERKANNSRSRDEPDEATAPKESDVDTAVRKTRPSADAPERFDDAAKAEWASTPESVKGATRRALSEMQSGLDRYKADADAFSEIKELDTLAKQNGTTIKAAIEQYTNLEHQLLSNDPQAKNAAIRHVFEYAGIDARDWAAKLMGQTPDQVAGEQGQAVIALRQELREVRAEAAKATASLRDMQEQSVIREIESFARDNPRLDELSNDVAMFLQTGRASNLQEAYDMADRLNPSPEAAHTGVVQDSAHTRNEETTPASAGRKSISGAPASGSDTSTRPGKKPGKFSMKESMQRAESRMGF